MSKHTPGPWRITEIRGETVILEPEQDGHVCKMSEWADEYTEEQEANARLIKAAPNMLHALKVCAGMFDMYRKYYTTNGDIERADFISKLADMAHGVIAEAEGENNE